MYRGDS